MWEDNHIASDLFNFYINQKLYHRYAGQSIDLEQIDEVDHLKITATGYSQIWKWQKTSHDWIIL